MFQEVDSRSNFWRQRIDVPRPLQIVGDVNCEKLNLLMQKVAKVVT